MMKKFGGFEGNAQTLRILTRLEKRAHLHLLDAPMEVARAHADRHGRLGLNLTMRALGAVLKYDSKISPVRAMDDSLEKGYYDSEEKVVASIKKAVAPNWPSGEKFKTIECQIMDVADDIAYCTYDLEDTLKGGFLTPIEMIRQVQSAPDLVAEINGKVRKAMIEEGVANPNEVTADEISGFLFDAFFGGGETASSGMIDYLDNFAIDKSYAEDGYTRTAFTSWLVGNLMGSLEFVYNAAFPSMSTIKLAPARRRAVEILKHLNYQLTIRAPRLSVVQYRGYDLVRKVFEALTTDKGRDLLPTDVRRLHDQCENLTEQRRIVCDFIAGMTDRYAVEFYSRL